MAVRFVRGQSLHKACPGPVGHVPAFTKRKDDVVSISDALRSAGKMLAPPQSRAAAG
jgi:hypothetical protein